MAEELVVRDIWKRYGRKTALSGVSMVLKKGRVYGLLGPNGMGKTTLLKIMAGILRSTRGKVLLDGDEQNHTMRNRIAFSPEDRGLYEYMRVREFLNTLSTVYSNWNKEKEQYFVKLLDIPYDELIRNLSRGFKARVRLLIALSQDAEFYLLDEPLSGIDPTSRQRIKDALRGGFDTDKTFVISSHLIGEIEHLFDYVFFIDRGEIVLEGEADRLREEHGVSIEGLYVKTFR